MDPALTNLLKYFQAVREYDLDALVETFTENAIYHHQSYKGFAGHDLDDPNGWHRTEGRSGLRELFAFRGAQDATHHVTSFARNGDLCFCEGYAVVHGDEDYVSFVSVFLVDDHGLMEEYITYTHRPRLPLLGGRTPITLD